MLQGHIIIMLKAYEFRALAYCLLKCRTILNPQFSAIKLSTKETFLYGFLSCMLAKHIIIFCANFVKQRNKR